MPVPVKSVMTAPRAGLCADDVEHAAPVAAVDRSMKIFGGAAEPAAVALTCTGPAAAPNVTVVFAWPLASVTAVAGDTVAEPDTTVNVTVAPTTGVCSKPVVTWTTRG